MRCEIERKSQQKRNADRNEGTPVSQQACGLWHIRRIYVGH